MEPLEQSQAYQETTQTSESTEIEQWRTIYQEVRQAFDLLVNNVSSQQTRIANVLQTNSLILGFSGAIAAIYIQNQGPKTSLSLYLYVASMCCLALGLVAATFALWPRIPPHDTDLFLNPSMILEQGRELIENQRGTMKLFENMSQAIVDNAKRTQHIKHVRFRRYLIFAQLISILAGLLLLVVAIIIRLF